VRIGTEWYWTQQTSSLVSKDTQSLAAQTPRDSKVDVLICSHCAQLSLRRCFDCTTIYLSGLQHTHPSWPSPPHPPTHTSSPPHAHFINHLTQKPFHPHTSSPSHTHLTHTHTSSCHTPPPVTHLTHTPPHSQTPHTHTCTHTHTPPQPHILISSPTHTPPHSQTPHTHTSSLSNTSHTHLHTHTHTPPQPHILTSSPTHTPPHSHTHLLTLAECGIRHSGAYATHLHTLSHSSTPSPLIHHDVISQRVPVVSCSPLGHWKCSLVSESA